MNRSTTFTICAALVFMAGCAPLKKTGEFAWNAPGKVVSGVAKTGKFIWNTPGNIVSGVTKTGKVAWDITPKSGPQLYETAKFIWGSSTKRLESARVDAIKGTYRCSFDACYDSVLTLARAEPIYVKKYNEEGEEVDLEGNVKVPDPGGFFDVFIDNRAKKHIVVSLSSNAKRKVAEAVFKELDLKYSAVK